MLFLISPFSDSVTGYLYALFQGESTELDGYKIHTSMSHLYAHHEDSGAVSLLKISKNFRGTAPGYHLTFQTGSQERMDEITKYCLKADSTCERISFPNFEGITVSKYIESRDQIYNQVFYFNSTCSVFAWHTGMPFDSKYLEVVSKFFGDNSSEENS